MRSHHGVIAPRRVLAAALVVAACLTLGAPGASAKDVTGRLGLGVEHALSGVSSATIRWWPTSSIGVTLTGGVDVIGITAGGSPDTEVDASIGGLYSFVQHLHANLSIGLRVGGNFVATEVTVTSDGDDGFDAGTEYQKTERITRLRIEIPLLLEFFLSDHFSISAGTGAGVAFRLDQSDVDVNIATASISGSFGIVYYF